MSPIPRFPAPDSGFRADNVDVPDFVWMSQIPQFSG